MATATYSVYLSTSLGSLEIMKNVIKQIKKRHNNYNITQNMYNNTRILYNSHYKI